MQIDIYIYIYTTYWDSEDLREGRRWGEEGRREENRSDMLREINTLEHQTVKCSSLPFRSYLHFNKWQRIKLTSY